MEVNLLVLPLEEIARLCTEIQVIMLLSKVACVYSIIEMLHARGVMLKN